MFNGAFEFNVDKKGRISIPAKFREILSSAGTDQLMVTCGFDDCLFAFPPEPWTKLRDKLQALSITNEGGRFLTRLLLGQAVECTLNEQGRISIPSVLLKAAQIEKEVIVTGVGSRIEIWNKESWLNYTGDKKRQQKELKEIGDIGI